MTLQEMKETLARERATVKDMIRAMNRMRWEIKQSRVKQKSLRAAIRHEAHVDRVVRQDQLRKASEARAKRVADRVAKTEARLAALREREVIRAQKATRKSTKGVVWSAEQVAALNAERNLA